MRHHERSRDRRSHSRGRKRSHSRDPRSHSRGRKHRRSHSSSQSRDRTTAGRSSSSSSVVYIARGRQLPSPSCTFGVPRFLSVSSCKSLLEDLGLRQAYALAKRGNILGWELIEQSHRFPPPVLEGAVHLFVEELGHPIEPSPSLVLDDPSPDELPFRGRQQVMAEIAENVENYYEKACSGAGINREGMLFVSFEGLSGIGKTRCLLEIFRKVEGNLSGHSKLKELHEAKAATSLYISFSCVSVGERKPHYLCPFFERMIWDKGAREAGSNFMRACLLSEGVYGLPFTKLSEEIQQWILHSEEGMSKLANNIRSALKVQQSQRIFVYTLLDEAQALVSKLSWEVAEVFLKGMWDYIGNFMSNASGWAPWESCQMVLLPVVAGTLIPQGGKRYLSDWLPMAVKLEYVSEDSAVEIIKGAVKSGRFSQCEQMVRNLVRDTSCLPRYLEYICIAWKAPAASNDLGSEKKSWASADELPLEDFENHIRKCLHLQLQRSAKRVAHQDCQVEVKRMLRLCLTGDPVPVMGTVEKRQCTMGYVSRRRTTSGFTFHSPVVFLASLAKELDVHTNVIPLHVSALEGNDFELPLLEIIHARMLLYAGTVRRIVDIFPGAFGSASALKAVIKIGYHIVFGTEKAQFYVRNGSSRDASIVLQSGVHFTRPFGQANRSMVTKTVTNTLAADIRVFASNEDKEVEIWGQAKGKTKPLGWNETIAYIEACFQECFNCGPGVDKFCVLFSLNGFTFPREDVYSLFLEKGVKTGDSGKYKEMFHHTLLLDRTSLDVVMPGVVQRHYCRS